jgi:serine/threonine-protein kinase
LRPIAPSARRVFASDERAAWNVVDRSGAPIARIEAAALNGRIQSFETQAASGAGAAPSAGSLAGPQAALFMVRAAVLVGCAWFARRNLKLRRADRVGAARLGVTVLCVSLASQLLGARWFGLNEAEWQLLLRSLGACLFTSAFGWTVYLAVEPYVRRAWPHRMTSWTRLLAGRWRDPLVGRDVLIGVCVSAVVIAVLLGHVLMADALGAPRPRFATFEVVDANLAANLVVSAILLKVTSGGVFNALFVLAVLVVLLALTGRKRVAEVGFGAVMFLLQLAVTSRAAPWMALLLAAVGAAYVSLTLLRFGLLALVVALFGVFTLWDFPLTLDVRAWHAGSALFACGVLVALAGLGAWIATGGAQPGRLALR